MENAALYASFRLWARLVEVLQQQDLLEDMREVYTQTILEWRAERDTFHPEPREQALRERDEARRERDEALRQRNFYRLHAENMERELDAKRHDAPVRVAADHRQLCTNKWIAHLKARRARVTANSSVSSSSSSRSTLDE